MSKEFLNEFRRRRKLEQERKIEQLSRLTEVAMQAALEIANIIKNECEDAEVYLYGSLVCKGFDKHSDIDILVRNFTGDYWKTLSLSQQKANPIEVSIACEEDCCEYFLADIHSYMVKLA